MSVCYISHNTLTRSGLRVPYEPAGIGGLDPDGVPANEPTPDSGVINGRGQWGNKGSFYNFTFEPDSTSVDSGLLCTPDNATDRKLLHLAIVFGSSTLAASIR
jgi:hypothetical protein